MRFPWLIPTCAAGLVLIGLGAIGRGDALAGVETGGLAAKQAVFACLAAGVFCGGCVVPPRWLRTAAPVLLAAAVGLLVLVYAFPPRGGSRRWIPLGPLLFQPSEFTKPVFVLALARYLANRRSHRTTLGLIPPAVLTAVPVALILKEPDLGTALVFFPVFAAVLVASGAKRGHLSAAVVLGVLCLPALWAGMNAEQRSRVTALFTQSPLADLGTAVRRGDGYHLHRSKEVYALGGVTGSNPVYGPGEEAVPDPAAYRLPAARTDFVLCLVAERYGLPGTLGVLGLFATLVAAGLRVSAAAADPFARLVAAGVTALLGSQAIINTAMTVGLTPVTGLALPLVSYGGSSLIFTALSLGLLCGAAGGRVEVHPDPLHFAGRVDR